MDDDSKLKELLAEWRADAQASPRFESGVWERIGGSVPTGGIFARMREWLLVSLPRPIYACALVVLFAGSGLILSDFAASRLHRKERARQEQRYLVSIDPVSMANQALHAQQ